MGRTPARSPTSRRPTLAQLCPARGVQKGRAKRLWSIPRTGQSYVTLATHVWAAKLSHESPLVLTRAGGKVT
eukprot:scaffold27823_cov42-Phaeocystis_antarctica.AAC.1